MGYRVDFTAFPQYLPALFQANESHSEMLARFLQNFLNLPFDLRKPLPDCSPNQTVIYTKIEMNQLVSHPCHFPPRNLGMPLAYFIRYLFHGFADDFKFSHHSTRGLVIRLKCIQIHSCGESFNAVYRCQDVLQVEGIVSHTAMTSRRIVSCNSARIARLGTTSTGCWSISSRYNVSPIKSNRSAPSSNSAKTSISLVAVCSPRTKEPKSPISLTL